MKEIKDEFIGYVVECLKDEDADVPFLIAPLVQAIDNNEFDEFFVSLLNYNGYHLAYDNESEKLLVILQRCNDDVENSVEYPNYSYEIQFGYEEKFWGYCDCKVGDQDYREDKHCCGHACDWATPTVSVKKVINVLDHDYKGDEHDYWDFEDGYYKLDQVAKAVKDQNERENRITYLQDTIAQMQAELAKMA